MRLNTNHAKPADRDFSGSYEVIPDDTEVRVVVHRIAGDDADSNGILTHSRNGGSLFLKLEFTVIGGEFNRRRFWENLYLHGDSEQAINISMTKLRAIVEAAREISPTDMSPAAQKKRDIDLKELDGMEFDCVVAVERAKPGSGFKDQNAIKRIHNPAAEPNGKSTVVAPAATKPAGNEKRKAAFAS